MFFHVTFRKPCPLPERENPSFWPRARAISVRLVRFLFELRRVRRHGQWIITNGARGVFLTSPGPRDEDGSRAILSRIVGCDVAAGAFQTSRRICTRARRVNPKFARINVHRVIHTRVLNLHARALASYDRRVERYSHARAIN